MKTSTGHWSIDKFSTGKHPASKCSIGNYSTGDYSTGNWSTGDYSTGNWSISNYSTGYFSTIDYSGLSLFNHPITKEELNKIEFPYFLYFSLTEWIEEKDMTYEEKRDNPSYKIIG